LLYQGFHFIAASRQYEHSNRFPPPGDTMHIKSAVSGEGQARRKPNPIFMEADFEELPES
jgi:hypothetical protein